MPPEIDSLLAALEAKDKELQDLRDQLRAIHNSDAWAILRTLGQLRYALAPHGTMRDRLTRQSLRGLRRIKKLAMQLSRAPEAALRSMRAAARGRPRIEAATRQNYAVICLPMIEWHFRFQRPQQLMRQFAKASHLVLYAANRFHRGTAARTRPIETNVLEMILPGDPAANVYQHMLSPEDRAGMLAAIERLGAELGLAEAIVVAQHPYWTSLAEALRPPVRLADRLRLHGRPRRLPAQRPRSLAVRATAGRHGRPGRRQLGAAPRGPARTGALGHPHPQRLRIRAFRPGIRPAAGEPGRADDRLLRRDRRVVRQRAGRGAGTRSGRDGASS